MGEEVLFALDEFLLTDRQRRVGALESQLSEICDILSGSEINEMSDNDRTAMIHAALNLTDCY